MTASRVRSEQTYVCGSPSLTFSPLGYAGGLSAGSGRWRWWRRCRQRRCATWSFSHGESFLHNASIKGPANGNHITPSPPLPPDSLPHRCLLVGGGCFTNIMWVHATVFIGGRGGCRPCAPREHRVGGKGVLFTCTGAIGSQRSPLRALRQFVAHAFGER